VKTLRIGSTVKRMVIGTVKPMSTDMQSGNAERARLYSSARWRQARLPAKDAAV
jgi:hypothetical protein